MIRCQPNGHRRRLLAAGIRANDVVVIKPPLDVVLARALGRPDAVKTARLVRGWYSAFTVTETDTLLEGFPLGHAG